MKLVLLAGGYGTRISEESHLKPKPMVEIGGVPIIIHIMRYHYKFGIKDFIICAGYKQEYIKHFFNDYFLMRTDVKFSYSKNKVTRSDLKSYSEDWNVTIVDTGLDTQTAGRLMLVKELLSDEDEFMMTYGDGLSDVNLTELLKLHKAEKKLCTITAINKPERFGDIDFDKNTITKFIEKKQGDSWINGGFMVMKTSVLNKIEKLSQSFEFDILPVLATEGGLAAYKHRGFWKCMDTVKDRNDLEKILLSGEAKWT